LEVNVKRFVDTSIWTKPWYRDLSPAEKCAWSYITAWCDSVGVWVPDFKGAEFNIGEEIDWDLFRKKVNGNVKVLESGKWFLPDFCDFQYGPLDENSHSKPIMSYIRALKRHSLWEGYAKGYDTLSEGESRGMVTPKEKEKEKEKEKDRVVAEKTNPNHAFLRQIFEQSDKAMSLMYQDKATTGREMKALQTIVERAEKLAPGLEREFLEKMAVTFRSLVNGKLRGKVSWLPSQLVTAWVWSLVVDQVSPGNGPEGDSPAVRMAKKAQAEKEGRHVSEAEAS
jgi:hypothetical protein